ncbi:MAG: APC family permease, partial [Actinomycetota bacterium]|nr:APC family permease [Actinomycetota bacterium]
YHGVTRTAALTRVIVVGVLIALAVIVAAIWASGAGDASRITGGGLLSHGWYGILQSAGLLFFAFAGYARIATMGEEVREPRRTIPRAIVIALGITVVVYAVIAVTVLSSLGPAGVAESPVPLAAAVSSGTWSGMAPVARIGAALASLGALLALIAGLGRTSLAMARESDLPRWLAAVHPRYKVPHRAEVLLAVVICAVILVTDLRGAIGFSSFGVLIYYLVANIAAYTQPRQDRRYPKALQVVGALACVVLVATLPLISVSAGLTMFAVGILYRVLRLWALKVQ